MIIEPERGNMCNLCRNSKPVKQVEVGETLQFDFETYIVKDPCYNAPGVWACVKHDNSFSDATQRDHHMRDHKSESGQFTCKIAWKCDAHGIEKP